MPPSATLAKPTSAPTPMPIAKPMSTHATMSAPAPTPISTEGPTRFSRRSFVEVAAFGVTALSLGTILSSCTGPTPSGAGTSRASDEVVIAINTGSEPEAGFDPFYSWGCGEHVHEPLIQSTLITTDENLDFVNDLAEQYACSDDRLTWTFVIRDDVKFSDGTKLTARDVAFTINGIKDFEGAELDLSYVDRAIAVDDTTVEIKLNKPFNALLYTLAVVGIVPAASYASDTYGANPIGSGRYLLEQWNRGQQVILKANPDYYGEAPKMKKVTVVFVSEDASLAAAQSGQVDIAFTAATLATQVPKGYELLSCKSVDCRGISLPSVASGGKRSDGEGDYSCGNAVTCNPEIRRAINLTIDREKMVENTLDGYGTVAYSVCDGMPWSSSDMEVATDLEQAAKILVDAGWVKGADGVYAKGDLRAEFTLFYPVDDSVRQAMANEFKNQLDSFGIAVTLKGSSWTTDSGGLYAHQYSDPIVWGWGANSPTQLYDLTYGPSFGNYASYENEVVDAHLDAALATVTVEESFDEWKCAQWDGSWGIAPQGAASWVWLANVDHLYFKRSGLNVATQKPHPHGHGWSLINNVDRWSW